MNLSTRFAVSVHILSVLYYNKDYACDSEFIAGSVNTNPVVIRRLVTALKKSGLVEVTPGVKGIKLQKEPSEISLYEIYNAVSNPDYMLFGLHDNTNPACPVGRNINAVLRSEMEIMQNKLVDSMRALSMEDVMNGIYTGIMSEEQ